MSDDGVHRQKVEVVLNEDSELYGRIAETAAAKGITVARAVDVLVTIGLWKHLEDNLVHLENMKK